MTFSGETVTFFRDAVASGSVTAAVDPRDHRLYVDGPVSVLAGDVATFRGFTRRVIAFPERWVSPWTPSLTGSLIQLESGPAFMPDLGELTRKTVDESFDESSGLIVPAVWVTVWAGPCGVEVSASQGLDPTVAEQVVGVQPFIVSTPLSLVDVLPGDRFQVTSSRDLRLAVRVLNVTRVLAGSAVQVRQFTAIDNQG